MDGKTITKIVSSILEERSISVKDFCDEIGVSQSAYSQWKKGRTPTPERIASIENYLGISFADYEKAEQLEGLRDDLRILLRSASDLPPSSVYALIAQVEKEKEKSVLPD